ncbi:polysulfide reductase [Micromonospora sp. ALFpr18c]|uniref:NrfD/PsrC family molybdoenzyme membrane anchor subunit n=1 Tax=unclassified Micromonospora TaxID=2617518 RepID=UPI00124AE785|nr:NrfD/PsrC family molybdoenzyme membrane anchor subunit [Micromonospora sp. ALFpr18c]KAB1937013.1 polysulfide reductase [Micromonospora sp. ALFpr18c]
MTDSPSNEPVGARFRDFQAQLDQPDGRRHRKRGRGRGDGGEQLTVPPADFTSYYGRPILKAPVWKHDIAGYLFTGGLAAGGAMIGAGAQLTGRPRLRQVGRWTALGGIAASAYLLVHDLGRPDRFHHMLRVVKLTSPMSMGTWILTAFGPAAGVAAIAEIAPRLPEHGVFGLARRLAPTVGDVAGLAAAATAPALATYTGVLLADTAVPAWHDAYPFLPFVFGGSGLAAAAGVGLIAAPAADTAPLRRLTVAAATIKFVGGHRMGRSSLTGEPYRRGRSGRLVRAGNVLLGVGTVGALLSRRSRVLAVLSGAALVASSVATRFGIFDAGTVSARDPKYTVVPQRERRDSRQGRSPAEKGT